MSSLTELTPQERLAISRRAIVRHMNRKHSVNDDENSADLNDAQLSGSTSQGAGAVVRHAIRTWWYHHPASAVADLARPLLTDYAKAHPFKLLGISAGTGAAIALIRPWRMVSMGIFLSTLKSSGLSSLLLSRLNPPPVD